MCVLALLKLHSYAIAGVPVIAELKHVACVVGVQLLPFPSQLADYAPPQANGKGKPLLSGSNYRWHRDRAKGVGPDFCLELFVSIFEDERYGPDGVTTALGLVSGYLGLPDALVSPMYSRVGQH